MPFKYFFWYNISMSYIKIALMVLDGHGSQLDPKLLLPLQKDWRKLGEQYGYPNCCIDFFCGPWATMTLEERDAHKETMAKKHQSGRIYCPNHIDSVPG